MGTFSNYRENFSVILDSIIDFPVWYLIRASVNYLKALLDQLYRMWSMKLRIWIISDQVLSLTIVHKNPIYRNPLLVLHSPSTCLESLVEFNQLVGRLDTLSSSSYAILLLWHQFQRFQFILFVDAKRFQFAEFWFRLCCQVQCWIWNEWMVKNSH